MPLDPDAPPVTEGDWYRPGVETTWQWQLKGEVRTGHPAEVYDIDLFDSSPELIATLHQAGRKVICYFSAGSSEDWRPDFDRFEAADQGEPLDDWPGERWLDIRSANVHAILRDRLALARDLECDGVEPDNVDGYTNTTGFPLTARDQLAFNRFLANTAHELGLAIGLKNSGDQAEQLVEYFDFELNEQCHEYDECDLLTVFPEQGRPVFNAEYADHLAAARALAARVCPAAREKRFRTLILPLDLDDTFRVTCDE